jgi:hypothetical protein
MSLKLFLLLISYSLQSILFITTSAMILLNTTENYLKNNSEVNLNISLILNQFSQQLGYCNSDNYCHEKIANSYCDSANHQCYCQKGYVLNDGSCLQHCSDDSSCIDFDINRLCLCESNLELNSCTEKLCKCKANYIEDPSKEYCVSDKNSLTPIDSNGLIIVCVVTGVSPLTIVLLAICCRKIANCKNRRDRNRSSGN